MLANEQMRFGARILAAIFGGPGIFYLWESFHRPDLALTAVIYLLIAAALSLCAGTASDDGGPRVLALCKAIFAPRRRR